MNETQAMKGIIAEQAMCKEIELNDSVKMSLNFVLNE